MQTDPLMLMLFAVLGAGSLAALAIIATRRKWITVLIGAMVFASTLGLPLDWRGIVMQTLLLPLQRSRSSLFLAAGVATLLLVLVHASWARAKGISLPAVLLLLMAYYASLMRAAHGYPQDGLLSLLYATATLMPLSLATKIALDNLDDFIRIFKMLAVVNAVWIGLVMVQLLADRNDVVTGKEMRFIGLLSNPQHAGSYLAVMLAVCLYLVLNDQDRRMRFPWIALLGIDLVLLGWTGSRTSLGMAVIGVSGVLYSRAGRAVLFLPLVAGFAYGMLKLLEAIGVSAFGFGRLVSTANTRREAWLTLLQDGLSNPLLGTGIENAVRSENGYLFGFSSFGIGMVLLSLILTAVSGIMCLQLLSKRSLLPREHRPLVDFLIAYIMVYFAGSMFEGYMMARVAANLSFFIIFTSMGALLIKLANAYAAEDDLAYRLEAEALDYGAELPPEPA